MSTAATAWQPHLVPDTYAELDGSQQNQAEAVKAAGSRLKRRLPAKSAADRCFIKQFAAEAHALLGSTSSSQLIAAGSSPQECNTSPQETKTMQDSSSGRSALPNKAEAKDLVMGSRSADEASACPQGIMAAQEESPAPCPNSSTAPAGEPDCFLLCLKIHQHSPSDAEKRLTTPGK